ncbi:MAG: methyl-accepting chemotaxis protein [Nitrosomonas sp. PRO4]|nr:methyl-accepting chemotaxis protein [Nitrosomonas sp. PRO4]
METHSNKLELTTGIATIRTNLPVITLSEKRNVRERIAFIHNGWILGIILAGFLLLLFITLASSVYHTQHSAAQSRIISQLHIQQAQLPLTIEHVLSGDSIALGQLHEYQYHVNQHVALLVQGGMFRQKKISALPDTPALNAYNQKWRTEAKKLGLILSHKATLTRLASNMRVISVTHSQLNKRLEELTNRMIEMGNLSNEIKTIETIKIHAGNIAKNAKTFFPGDLALADIQAQLIEDRAQISSILQILSQGSNGLAKASDKDETIQDLLSHLYALMRKFDDQFNGIEQEIVTAMAIQSTAHQLIDNNEALVDSIKELDQIVHQQATDTVSLFDTLIYCLIAGSTVIALFFVRSLRFHIRKQEIVSKNEMETAHKAIQTLLNDMKKIADGDLTVRTNITNPMTGAIADAINCTIEELHTLVEQVNQASSLVVKASNKAQDVSSELLAAAQHQTAKIEETTVAVLGMTESITEVSDMATESARVAKQSLATAEKGATAVRESIAGMNEIRTYIQDTSKRIKRLGESSQEIGEIVALITDITEQTNVLALNAALQATAAGEAGRGFTVIAQEVQRLAERSAEASKQIGELIVTIQGDTQDAIAAMERSTVGVTQGARRSDAAGRALEEIESVSKQLAELVTAIFEATNMQTRAAHQVVANMEEILHITRQNTEGTRQTTASVKQIAGFTSELRASVSNFNV